MKKTAAISTVLLAAIVSFSSCGSDSESKKAEENENQVEAPVTNSGPTTEAERAKDAVKDSALGGAKDSAAQGNDLPDSVTGSKPHH